MKKISILTVILAFAVNAIAQCDFYMPLKVGAGWQMQTFNAKDKLQSTAESKIISVNTVGTSTVADIVTVATDDKGVKAADMNYKVSCSSTGISIEIKSLIDPKTMESYKGMDIKMESEDLQIPASISVGTILKDAKLKMIITNNGMAFSEMDIEYTDRKVESKETVKTPAGDFEAYKITYNISMITKVMNFPMKINSKAVEYYAKSVGVVRNESYDKNGKLQSYSVVSKIY